MPQFNKLVRDNIPAIITATGQTPQTRILDDAQYAEALKQKLQEEVAEFLQDNNTEELADIMEVVYALAGTLGASPADLEAIRADKAQQRGSFADKVFLISAE